jgi:hypothetical protein
VDRGRIEVIKLVSEAILMCFYSVVLIGEIEGIDSIGIGLWLYINNNSQELTFPFARLAR